MNQNTGWTVRIEMSDGGEMVSVHAPTDLLRRFCAVKSISPPADGQSAIERKLAYSIEEVVEMTSISRSKVVRYIADNKLRSRRNGQSHIILRADLDAFLVSLPTTFEEA